MIEINPGIFLVQIATFLIALFVVWKLAWGPFNVMLKERQDKIRKDLELADNARLAADRFEAEYKQRMVKIQADADALLAAARQESMKVREELLAVARKEAEEMRQRMREQVKEERENLVRDIRAQVTTLSLDIAEKLVRQTVNRQLQENLVQEMIQHIDTTPGAGQGKPS